MLSNIANKLNILIDFLAKRDLDELSSRELHQKYNIDKAELCILFGGSIPEGAKIFAKAYKEQLANHYLIVGGIGHTTSYLRDFMKDSLSTYDLQNLSEAEIFNYYLQTYYQINDCLLETKSTNCGNNIIFTLELLNKLKLAPKSIIFMQDASMQHRMEAGFRKYLSNDIKLINYATYKIYFTVKDNMLSLSGKTPWCMWDINKYIELLMGEIPRLLDNNTGYGPQGKDFIAHVDIPTDVQEAYSYLSKNLNITTRAANDLYDTKI